MLGLMEVGDQVAAKPGTNKLTYAAPDVITSVHFIVSGLGAVPGIAMISEVRLLSPPPARNLVALVPHLQRAVYLLQLLPGSDSSIEQANLVWVNPSERDFVMYGEAEKLWYKYSKVLDVGCVVEADLVGPGLFQNDAFMEVSSAPPPPFGRRPSIW